MNITIEYTAAVLQGAGVGRYTRELVAALAQAETPHHYTLVVTKDAQQERPALPPNFRYVTLPFTQRQAALGWQRLRLPLSIERWSGPADLFHAPDFTLPPLRHAKGIVTIHDVSFLAAPEFHEPRLQQYLAAAVPRAVAHAHHVLADSESTRQETIKWLKVPPTKVSVVYPGIDPRFRPLDATQPADQKMLQRVRAAYGLDNPFILAVGTLEPRKNFDTLLRAYASLFTTGQIEHELIIAGGGGWKATREDLLQLTDALGLGGNVLFPGYVSDELLPALYNLATLVVYPSHYEGFGLPVLEALACGRPVVTIRNTSLPEAGGELPLYIKESRDVEALAETIAQGLRDHQWQARVQAQGPSHAARFGLAHMAASVLEVYDRVAGNTAPQH